MPIGAVVGVSVGVLVAVPVGVLVLVGVLVDVFVGHGVFVAVCANAVRPPDSVANAISVSAADAPIVNFKTVGSTVCLSSWLCAG